MKLLPYENLLLKTPLTESQVEIRLKNFVEPKKFRVASILAITATKPYEGEIKANWFSIRRIIFYRNQFIPQIEGVMQYEPDQTVIRVKMRLQTLTLVFICIWMSFVSIACIAILATGNLRDSGSIPFGMLLFGYILTLGCFKAESIRSKRELAELFDAEIEEL